MQRNVPDNKNNMPKFKEGLNYVFNKNKMSSPSMFEWSSLLHGLDVVVISEEMGYIIYSDNGKETKYNVIPKWCSIKTN